MRLVLVFFLCFVLANLQVYSQDPNCNIIWDDPILLSDTAYDAYSPKIALSGDDTVHVTWESGKPGIRLPYRRSTTAGLNFDPTRDVLTDSIKYPYRTSWNHILAQGNRVYIFSAYYATSTEPLLMHISTDCGTTWGITRSITDTVGIPQSVALNLDTLAIVYHHGYRRIIRSTDGGETWTRTNEDLSVYSQIALTPTALHLIYYRGVNSSAEVEYRISHDLGDTWYQTKIISDIDGYWSDMPIISSDGDSTVLVAWRDTKHGCLGVLGCSIESITGTIPSKKDSVIWREKELLTEIPRGFRVEASLLNGMRAVGWVDEVTANDTFHVVTRVSKRKSIGWCPIIDHTPDIQKALYPVVALSSKGIHIVWVELIGQRIAIFYQRGVFFTTDVKEGQRGIPEEFCLSQNYPNPFNPKTNIKYKVQSTEYVSIRVYDVFGREVAMLVNERLTPSEYSVEWNAEGFASGVYFVRMWAGKYFSTMKAVLMK